jgi:hypothetical protein
MGQGKNTVFGFRYSVFGKNERVLPFRKLKTEYRIPRGALHENGLRCYTSSPRLAEGPEDADLAQFFPKGWGMNVCKLHSALRWGMILAMLTTGLGCGQDDALTPVRGRVFYHGQPLPGGTIVFTPYVERGGRGPLAWCEIGSDGRYMLRTGEKFGTIPGWYRVTIAAPARSVSPGQAIVPPVVDLPRKYSDPEQSGLLREVQPGKSDEQDFHLE